MTASDSDCIHVVCAADANYAPYAGIALSSVLGANRADEIHLHVLSDGIKPKDITRMSRMACRAGARFSSYDIEQVLQSSLGLSDQVSYYSRTAYGRLFLGDLLPRDIRRVIYLDCDVVCVSSLRELWQRGEGLKLMAAVRDVWVDRDSKHKLSMGIPTDRAYYNTGVLVINVEAWRNGNVGQRLIGFIRERRKARYVDQDAINSLLGAEITELPRQWNAMVTSPIPGDADAQMKHAAIIHFFGGFKPWHFGYRLRMGTGAAAFRRAKAVSPWRWRLPDFHIARFRRRLRRSWTKGVSSLEHRAG